MSREVKIKFYPVNSFQWNCFLNAREVICSICSKGCRNKKLFREDIIVFRPAPIHKKEPVFIKNGRQHKTHPLSSKMTYFSNRPCGLSLYVRREVLTKSSLTHFPIVQGLLCVPCLLADYWGRTLNYPWFNENTLTSRDTSHKRSGRGYSSKSKFRLVKHFPKIKLLHHLVKV